MSSSCVALNLKENLNFSRILNWNFFSYKWPNWISMNWKSKLSRLNFFKYNLFLLIFFLLRITSIISYILKYWELPISQNKIICFISNQLYWWGSLAFYLISNYSLLFLQFTVLKIIEAIYFKIWVTLGCILIIKC